ncbi:MAG: 2-hydroxyacyl-CoA dehydratase [Candidatus Omnitrophica bacterium]|nr:2-hydroxyacyl-CoA dehydratase [Candidatus Omnitrophota bacterium]
MFHKKEKIESMWLNSAERNNSKAKIEQKIKKEIQEEYRRQADSLRKRDDFREELEYFLEILSLPISPREVKKRFSGPFVGLYCIQAPLELFDALGFHPIRLCSGSLAIQRLSAPFLPALSCPLIKSCISAFYLDESIEKLCDIVVVPTTCDWNTKLPEMIPEKASPLYIMELPHIKESERGQIRWLEEIYELKRFLQQRAGRKLNRRQLQISVNKYMKGWQVFGRLIEFRRKRLICGTWSIVLANAFMIDDVESWTERVNIVLKNYGNPKGNSNPGVFLAGSPVFFPYLKISELIEEAGMDILADELCTSERLMASVVYDEPSEYGLLKALSERYHLPCSCPTYIDNDRRLKNILNTMRAYNIKGIVYHLLKGCHPYDIESFYFEKVIKENGFHFLKIESDYSREDRQNILARLEAFRETLC